jgi:hypothetical protein
MKTTTPTPPHGLILARIAASLGMRVARHLFLRRLLLVHQPRLFFSHCHLLPEREEVKHRHWAYQILVAHLPHYLGEVMSWAL